MKNFCHIICFKARKDKYNKFNESISIVSEKLKNDVDIVEIECGFAMEEYVIKLITAKDDVDTIKNLIIKEKDNLDVYYQWASESVGDYVGEMNLNVKGNLGRVEKSGSKAAVSLWQLTWQLYYLLQLDSQGNKL